MLTLFTWSTPNARKVSIALEEMGLPYRVQAINIAKGDQKQDAYLAINPNGKVPALVDDETGVTLSESGAILWYLAEKSGQLLTADLTGRVKTLEWLMWQMSAFGPMLGQAHHFLHYNPEASDYANRRFGTEAATLYGRLEQRLTGRDHIVDALSIADIAIWPWVARHAWQSIDLGRFPAVRAWFLRLADRPAFQRGYRVPDAEAEIPMPE